MLASGNGPPVWLVQVPHMALHNGCCCVDEVVELRLSPPSGYHGIYLVPILLVVVMDKAVCVGLPSPLGWPDPFGGNTLHGLLGPL